jgi:hypothetical protein
MKSHAERARHKVKNTSVAVSFPGSVVGPDAIAISNVIIRAGKDANNEIAESVQKLIDERRSAMDMRFSAFTVLLAISDGGLFSRLNTAAPCP